MLSLPSSLLRAPPPPSRLSAHFASRLIEPTLLLPFPPGTRRVSPVDPMPLYPCRRCYPATALVPSCRYRYQDTAFAYNTEARPVRIDFYEATSAFTSVTTRIVAHPAIRGFVDGLQKATFPSPPAIQATGLPAFTLAGLSPASACGPSLGTRRVKHWRSGSRLVFVFPVALRFLRECHSIPTIPYFQRLLVKPYVRFSLIRLSCSLRIKGYATYRPRAAFGKKYRIR
jgi:hypothetical protein